MADRRYWNEPVFGSTTAVRQHTVPRMYLAHFAIDGRIPVYDFKTGEQFEASINDVAVERSFYDIHVGRRKLSTERWLAMIEGNVAPIIGDLVGNPDLLLNLPSKDENVLSRFIGAQMFRSPAFRENDAEMRQQLVSHMKRIGKRFLEQNETPEDAEEIWAAWAKKPDEWFLHEKEPYQPARTAAFMLGEVKGYVNILRAMPWRIGSVAEGHTIYTSDNPISRHPLPTVQFADFSSWWYFVPLSPKVMLQIGPGLTPKGKPVRCRKDFNYWETSFARHVVTENASRFLYGPEPYVSRECALSCLQRIDMQRVQDAMRLQAYDPNRLY